MSRHSIEAARRLARRHGQPVVKTSLSYSVALWRKMLSSDISGSALVRDVPMCLCVDSRKTHRSSIVSPMSIDRSGYSNRQEGQPVSMMLSQMSWVSWVRG